MDAAGNSSSTRDFQICQPLSPQHQRGMLWFWNLSSAAEDTKVLGDDGFMLLRRSQEFYDLYAQTGENRYLTLCEAFLKDSLTS